MTIVSDSSVIMNLAVIEQLQLLPELFVEVMIPDAVYREVAICINKCWYWQMNPHQKDKTHVMPVFQHCFVK